MTDAPFYAPLDTPPAPRRPTPPPRQSRWWLWLIAAAGGVVLSCAGCLGVLGWIGARGPDTAVYAGHAVPTRFVEEMRGVGALEEGEQLRYFYSAALVDITGTFCFVSDRKVATYASNVDPMLTAIPFEEITDASLYRDESFLVDSEIVLERGDGAPVSLLVSSERDGDVRFFEAIRGHIPNGAAAAE